MHILITGSSGTIGTRLAETFLERGIPFTGVDRRENRWLPEVEKNTAHVDLLVPQWSGGIKATPDLIIHLAANARVYKLTENPDLAVENMQTTFHVLEYARRAGVKNLILASSREVYGSQETGSRREEDVSIFRSESPYTASKITLEAFARSYAHCYGLSIVIVRYSNVYGMYDDSDRVIPLFIRLARQGKPLTVYGGNKTLDFTYIDDAVNGTLAIIDHFDDVAGETFNIATGRGTKIVDVATMISDAYGGKSKINIQSNRPGEVLQCVCNISKTQKELGYEPRVNIEKGIKKSIQWYGIHSGT